MTGQPRILILDDDVLARRMLADTVQQLGYRPILTGSVGDALSQDLSQLAAVLCDFAMPGMDGAEVLEAVRDWRGAGVPFIFVTAKATDPGLLVAAKRFDATVLEK